MADRPVGASPTASVHRIMSAAFDEFDELAGDRAADDKAIVGGIARLDGRPVMIIGHQKGRETKEKIRRNFGMPQKAIVKPCV